jgi:hypothetical protein
MTCRYIPPSRRALPGTLDERQCGEPATWIVVDSNEDYYSQMLVCGRHAHGYMAKFRAPEIKRQLRAVRIGAGR